jgi:UPF0176 protein
MIDMSSHKVLLYYQFTRIGDPKSYTAQHLKWCRSLGLLGRILIAEEGINGTVSGTAEACREYMDGLEADPQFAGITFKIDDADGHVFRKLYVRERDEIITLTAEGLNGKQFHPNDRTGTHLSPTEWRERMSDPDAILLDGRNNYESAIGHFKNALCPDLENFRDFPAWIEENLGDSKDKPILTYCTGGIRCEKLSAWMIDAGFTQVFQLSGGIVSYGKDEQVQGDQFDGSCYVFDERIAVPINHTESRTTLSRCHHCDAPSEDFTNCLNVLCNLHMALCPTCAELLDGCCSEACKTADSRRKPFEKLNKISSTSKRPPTARAYGF